MRRASLGRGVSIGRARKMSKTKTAPAHVIPGEDGWETIDLYGGARIDWFARGKTLIVDLMDTRAADGLHISYDFERDGWSIKQASTFSWEADDPNCGDPDWQEVAFVKAWARKKDEDDDE
jgi:hypothetical protein